MKGKAICLVLIVTTCGQACRPEESREAGEGVEVVQVGVLFTGHVYFPME